MWRIRDSYEPWSVRPDLATVPLSKSDEAATLAIDSTGEMWIASDVTTTIEVRYSAYPYLSFQRTNHDRLEDKKGRYLSHHRDARWRNWGNVVQSGRQAILFPHAPGRQRPRGVVGH